MKKMNKKGYLTIEIIIAFMLTMMIISVVLSLVIKLNNKNQDMSLETVLLNDKTTISKVITDDLDSKVLTNIIYDDSPKDEKDEVILEFNENEYKKVTVTKNTFKYEKCNDKNCEKVDDSESFEKELDSRAEIDTDNFVSWDKSENNWKLNIDIYNKKGINNQEYSVNLALAKADNEKEFKIDTLKQKKEQEIEEVIASKIDMCDDNTTCFEDMEVYGNGDLSYLSYSQTLDPGLYYLGVWGGSGGAPDDELPSYGGYAEGFYYIEEPTTIYIYPGGKGRQYTGLLIKSILNPSGGYNGGGYAKKKNSYGGGGATHIALVAGELSTLENEKDKILLVAGGGGGTTDMLYNDRIINALGYGGGESGHNGGKITNGDFSNIELNVATGGTQTRGGTGSKVHATYCLGSKELQAISGGGSFGQGADGNSYIGGSGGGGGWYGGGGGLEFDGSCTVFKKYKVYSSAGGGSGYISDKLFSGQMSSTKADNLILYLIKPTSGTLFDCSDQGGCAVIIKITSDTSKVNYDEIKNN